MSKPTKSELLDRNETLRDQVDFLARKLREERLQEQRVRRALYAGTRRYLRQQGDLRSAVLLADARGRAIFRLQEQLDTLQADVTQLKGYALEDHKEKRQLVRALAAGSRRYTREQQRHRDDLLFSIERANERVALVEESAVQSALTALEAIQDAHQSRKTAAAATRRADKLAAKLMIRARQTGKERQAWVGQAQGRERALVAAGKRVRGLEASLRKVKAQLAAERQESAALRRDLDRTENHVRQYRQKLRESNKSVLMAALGGGLEVQPISGRPFENTAGYSPAARRAAEGHQ